MVDRPGLIGCINPTYFKTIYGYGAYTNCYTFMTGFDDEKSNIKVLNPEDLGWLDLKTKDEWQRKVMEYFKPNKYTDFNSTAYEEGKYDYTIFKYINTLIYCEKIGLTYIPEMISALCFPFIEGALDYHWAIKNGEYWIEQAGFNGPLNIWVNANSLIEDVYKRCDKTGKKLYVKDSHFFFNKII